MEDALTKSNDHALGRAEAFQTEEWVCAQYQELGSGLRRYLARLLGDPGAAEDIVQEVFLRLYEAVQQKRRIENLRAWTFQVGHNLAIDHQRRCGAEGWTAKAAQEEARRADSPNAEAALLEAERRRLVEAALTLVTPSERQVLELRAEGLRYREIAELMGLQVSTVTTFLVRAVRKIARQIHGQRLAPPTLHTTAQIRGRASSSRRRRPQRQERRGREPASARLLDLPIGGGAAEGGDRRVYGRAPCPFGNTGRVAGRPGWVRHATGPRSGTANRVPAAGHRTAVSKTAARLDAGSRECGSGGVWRMATSKGLCVGCFGTSRAFPSSTHSRTNCARPARAKCCRDLPSRAALQNAGASA